MTKTPLRQSLLYAVVLLAGIVAPFAFGTFGDVEEEADGDLAAQPHAAQPLHRIERPIERHSAIFGAENVQGGHGAQAFFTIAAIADVAVLPADMQHL